MAPVDLAEHSQYFAAAFNSAQSFQRDENNLQCLPVGIDTSQAPPCHPGTTLHQPHLNVPVPISLPTLPISTSRSCFVISHPLQSPTPVCSGVL